MANRGGSGRFNWQDVIALDRHRENYLGNSVKAPTGRWARGRDLTWYAKDASAADTGRAEIEQIQQREADAMAEALGVKIPTEQEVAYAKRHVHRHRHSREHRSRRRSRSPICDSTQLQIEGRRKSPSMEPANRWQSSEGHGRQMSLERYQEQHKRPSRGLEGRQNGDTVIPSPHVHRDRATRMQSPQYHQNEVRRSHKHRERRQNPRQSSRR